MSLTLHYTGWISHGSKLYCRKGESSNTIRIPLSNKELYRLKWCFFAFVETFYSESDVKQVDVSSIVPVLAFGILPLGFIFPALQHCFNSDLLPCMMKMVLTYILVSTCISYELVILELIYVIWDFRKKLSYHVRSHWSISVLRWGHVNTVVAFQIHAYFKKLFYKSNTALFLC